MAKEFLRVGAQLTTFRPKVDGSMTLSFATQEVDKDLINQIIEMHRQFGWLIFSPNQVQPNAVPEDDAKPSFGVSPSRKLKNTIYALYMELGAPYGKTGFEKFYEERVERLRGVILDELQTVNRAKQNNA